MSCLMKAKGGLGPVLAEAACWTSSVAMALSAVLSLCRRARPPALLCLLIPRSFAFQAALCSQAQGLWPSFLCRQGEAAMRLKACLPTDLLSASLQCLQVDPQALSLS